MTPVPTEPYVGERVVTIDKGHPILAEAVDVSELLVKWRGVNHPVCGEVPRSTWMRSVFAQRIMRESGLLGSCGGGENTEREKDLLATLQEIGKRCRRAGQLEALSRQFSTKIIAQAAADLRAIQQLVFERTGRVEDEI